MRCVPPPRATGPIPASQRLSGASQRLSGERRQLDRQKVAEYLRVNEVRIAEDERFVICHNPEGAEGDAAIRARMIAQLKELIDGTDALTNSPRRCGPSCGGVISTKPGLNLRRPGPHRREHVRRHLTGAAP